MLQAGLLEPIFTVTRNAFDPKARNDHETIRYCLLVVANLSVSRENHPKIMAQCLENLAGFSKHQDVKARQHAIFALGNLCANPDNIESIMLSGALKTLVTYAFPSTSTSTNVQFQAIAALRGISTHQTMRMQVVREGGLEPLVLAAKSDSIEVQRETAATLANLALAEENKVRHARESGPVLEPGLSSEGLTGVGRRVIRSGVRRNLNPGCLGRRTSHGCCRLRSSIGTRWLRAWRPESAAG